MIHVAFKDLVPLFNLLLVPIVVLAWRLYKKTDSGIQEQRLSMKAVKIHLRSVCRAVGVDCGKDLD